MRGVVIKDESTKEAGHHRPRRAARPRSRRRRIRPRCRASPTTCGRCSGTNSTPPTAPARSSSSAATTLKDPARKNYFRMMAAMDFLAETLGADALEDLLPYLGHDYWRLRDHSQKLAAELVTAGGGGATRRALRARPRTPTAAAGILEVFATSEADAGLELAKAGDEARRTAGPPGRDQDHLRPRRRQGPARHPRPPEAGARRRRICTAARRRCSPAATTPPTPARVRDAVIAMLPDSDPAVRPTLYYLLAQHRRPAVHRGAQEGRRRPTASPSSRKSSSPCPTRPAARPTRCCSSSPPPTRPAPRSSGAQSVRRMVLGPKGYGDITSSRAHGLRRGDAQARRSTSASSPTSATSTRRAPCAP